MSEKRHDTADPAQPFTLTWLTSIGRRYYFLQKWTRKHETAFGALVDSAFYDKAREP